MTMNTETEDLIFRLRKRAEIRRQIPHRKSVQEGQPDRIADLLDEAAMALIVKSAYITYLQERCKDFDIGYAEEL